jgi:imidazolonepropionase-like amidohydrolase
MTPLQAIRAATTVSAELIDVDDRGRLEAGMLSDVIASRATRWRTSA